jgi:hypothetical protein
MPKARTDTFYLDSKITGRRFKASQVVDDEMIEQKRMFVVTGYGNSGPKIHTDEIVGTVTAVKVYDDRVELTWENFGDHPLAHDAVLDAASYRLTPFGIGLVNQDRTIDKYILGGYHIFFGIQDDQRKHS